MHDSQRDPAHKLLLAQGGSGLPVARLPVLQERGHGKGQAHRVLVHVLVRAARRQRQTMQHNAPQHPQQLNTPPHTPLRSG
jgi:hypothetical protein